MQSSDVLEAIQKAALLLAEEKSKIDAALEGLRKSVKALDEFLIIDDEGYILVIDTDPPRKWGVFTVKMEPAPEVEVETFDDDTDIGYVVVPVPEPIKEAVIDRALGPKPPEPPEPATPEPPAAPSEPVAEPAPEPDRKPEPEPEPEAKPTPPRPTQSPGSAPSTPGPSATTTNHGLALSPKPRSDMRTDELALEERLDRIIGWALASGRSDFTALEANAELKEPDARITEDFRRLQRRNVLKRTGENRRRPGMRAGAGGRATPVYTFRDSYTKSLKEAASPKADAAPAKPEPQRRALLVTLEDARDAAVKLKKFTLRDMIEEMGLPQERPIRSQLREHLLTMTERGWFKQLDLPGEPVQWEYITPTDMGAAAKFDLEHPRGIPSQRTGGPVVEGIGGSRPKSSDKNTQQLLDAIVRQWGLSALKATAKNHWIVFKDGVKVTTLSGSPGSRTLASTRGKLRRAGLVGI